MCMCFRCGSQASFFFFFNDTATTEIYTLSLHDALPIYDQQRLTLAPNGALGAGIGQHRADAALLVRQRSEEHTSELQSPCNLVCRLLLEKKKTRSKAPGNTGCSRMLTSPSHMLSQWTSS